MDKNRLLWQQVDRLLWQEWDPIGINAGGPDDEYSGYVPSIVRLLLEGADVQKIAQRLHQHTLAWTWGWNRDWKTICL